MYACGDIDEIPEIDGSNVKPGSDWAKSSFNTSGNNVLIYRGIV